MDPLIGKRLGKYEIQTEIGRGGMGIVYRGHDPILRRAVAIKILPPQLTYDTQFVQRFRQEAVLAASLRHPNIVTIFDVGEQDNTHYIVMEYLEGATLEALLPRQGPVVPAQAGRIIQQVADALDFAHGRGIIHRDVKPANIMVEPDGRAILMDFGLVRAAEGTSLTRTGTFLGTPEYMSPEQAMGTQVDGRSDIYSLGVVIYRMLTGRVPFARTTPLGVTYAHVHEPPPPLRQVRADLPAAIETVVSKALAKRPEDRYQKAGALANAFAAAASGTPLPQPEETVISRQPGRPKTSRRVAPVVIVGLMASVAILAGVLVALTRLQAPGESAQITATSVSVAVVPSATLATTPAAVVASTPLALTRSAVDTPASPAVDTPVAPSANDASVQPTSTAKVAAAQAQPTATPAPPVLAEPTQEPRQSPLARVTNASVNLRGGPGTAYQVVGQARQGTTYAISAKSANGAWWQVCCVQNQPVWVSADVVTTEGDVTSVPLARDVPPPTAPLSPTAAPQPARRTNGQCQPWHKRPAPGYGILLVENHIGEELLLEWTVGGSGQWRLAAKQGDVPGRWWRELPVGHHEFADSTGTGFGHISVNVADGQPYISPIWYNDQKEERLYPMDIPAGCR